MATGEATQFRAGDRVAGRYVVRRFIARGGMGEVYEAEDAELRQIVALKTVHPREARLELAVERFKREIHLARRVTHPNVCRIYDVGYHTATSGESVIFLSMELLEGETLAQFLKVRGALEPEEALPLVLQMMDALIAAHAAGVVHRDFKCENVFLVPSDEGTRVVVTDFGVARGVEYDEFAAHVTVADAAVGTPAYMAPEQIEGAAITPAIDQYALGVVLFEMMTGHLPFTGDTPIATAVKRLTQAPPSPEEIRPGLDPCWAAVIRRCLARRPEERFGSVREAREALAAGAVVVVASTPAIRDSASPLEATAPVASDRHRRQRWLLAAVSVLLIVAVTQAVVRVRRSLASPFAGLSGIERRAVAVVPFRNLAQRDEFDWLSVALAEMVASEIRATRGLRAVAGDTAARAGADLELGAQEELGGEALNRLRDRLGADLVVAGSFTVLGTAGDASVRLAVRIDDLRSHETIGETVESGAERDLFELIGRIGERLRELLGNQQRARGLDTGAVTPKSPRAARLYSEGLLELRAFRPQAALDLLNEARGVEPGNPMIRAALAATWAALGFEQKAHAEAEEALKSGASLPPEDRFAVEALAAELRRDWEQACESWGQLWAAFPDNLDYGLKLANAQLEARRADDALSTVSSLRSLPEPDRSNPRIDLAEAAVAGARSDYARQRDAARRAAARAEAIEAPLLVAEARVREAEALRKLGQPGEAEDAGEIARQLYRALGDRVGEARALTVSAGALFDRGELAAAKEANEHALASYREAGDRGGTARTLNGLAVLARNLGDPALALELYAEALTVLEEIGDRRGTAYTKVNLAAAVAEEGRLAESREAVDAALTVFRELGDKSGIADALLNLGVLEHQMGALDAAATRLEEALSLKRELGLKPGEASALAALGGVALDRGSLTDAERRFEEAVGLATETDGRAALANALAGQGQAAFEAADVARSRDLLERSLALRTELGRSGKIDETRTILARVALDSGQPRNALTEIERLSSEERSFRAPELATQLELIRARALAALGRSSEARASLSRASTLAGGSESPQTALHLAKTALALELAGARVDALPAAEIQRMSAIARQRGFEIVALELEILAVRRGLRGAPADGRQELLDLAGTARRKGLLRLEHLALAAVESG